MRYMHETVPGSFPRIVPIRALWMRPKLTNIRGRTDLNAHL